MEIMTRKLPAIEIDGSYTANEKGIILAAFVGIISLAGALVGLGFLWFGIIHWADINFQRFAGLLLGVVWTLLFAAQTWMCFSGIGDVIANIARRKRWLKRAVRSEVKIIDRKEETNDYAESMEETWECSLAILLPPSTAAGQHGQVAWFRVSDRVYSQYSDRDAAVLLSDPSDQGIFIFEGE